MKEGRGLEVVGENIFSITLRIKGAKAKILSADSILVGII